MYKIKRIKLIDLFGLPLGHKYKLYLLKIKIMIGNISIAKLEPLSQVYLFSPSFERS